MLLVGAGASAADLEDRLDRVLEAAARAGASWGVEVRDADTGAVLYSHGAELNLEPASLMKLVMTAAALDLLGPELRFETSVESAGHVDGLGRLLGDLYLVGGGDPNLSGRFFDGDLLAPFRSLARQLADAGIQRVEGRVIGHEGLFRGERRPEGWDWEDLVWWYGAEVSALSFNDNAADLTAAPGDRAGSPLLVDAKPRTRFFSVTSKATTAPAGSDDELRLVRELGSNTITLSGGHPKGAKRWEGRVALEDPALYAATVFEEVLASEGVRVSGGVTSSSDPLPDSRRRLALHQGPPLRQVIAVVNKESINLHAEMLLRHVGVGGAEDDTLESAREAVAEFLARLGVEAEGWHIQDGSGLSQSNLVTARGLCQLLVAMQRHPAGAAFRESLAVAGRDGTLEYRLRGGARERVRAKTGTLRHVSALAGYASARDGRTLAFAAILNHFTEPSPWREIDRFATALVH